MICFFWFFPFNTILLISDQFHFSEIQIKCTKYIIIALNLAIVLYIMYSLKNFMFIDRTGRGMLLNMSQWCLSYLKSQKLLYSGESLNWGKFQLILLYLTLMEFLKPCYIPSQSNHLVIQSVISFVRISSQLRWYSMVELILNLVYDLI